MKKITRTSLTEERKLRQWSQQELADQLGTTRRNISRWESGVSTPGPYFRAKLCELFGKSPQELGLRADVSTVDEQQIPTTSLPEIFSSPSDQSLSLWSVPYPRNPHFTGRDEILDLLDQHLSPEGCHGQVITRRAALAQPQAIKGLGGIGKTQIALEYAYRARERDRYAHVFWINADSEEAISIGFVTLAKILPDFPEENETNQHKLVAAVKRWLEQCPQSWLLIFDNVEEPSLIQEYFPTTSNGSMLLTTRASAVGSLAIPIEVEQMGLVEGTQFLLHRAQRLRASDEERNEATNVVIALDGFPLALDQAGAYIEETGCSFSDYLQLYRDHRKALLARRGNQATNYPASVATTWALSFQKIEQSNPAAAELLRLCVFLAPDHIPEELLQQGAAYWPPVLQRAAPDLFTFNQMLEALLRFSLVKRLTESRTLSIHRLVQAVQIDNMEPEEQHQWAACVVRAVNTVFPRDPKKKINTWPQCLRYLGQAQVCEALVRQYLLLLPEAADLLNRTAIYLSKHASYTLAEPLYRRAIAINEQLLGPGHPHVASPLNELAELYYRQGKYAEAELYYRQALSILEQTLGPDHLAVAEPLIGLAETCRAQGNYEEAEQLLLRGLTLRERALGEEHDDMAQPLYVLAVLYAMQGRYEKAELLFQRALSIRERVLGPAHPEVAPLLQNLANVFNIQGRYEEAEVLYQRALSIRERVLEPAHPDLAVALSALGGCYLVQTKYEQAEPLYQQAISIWEQVLGLKHPDLAISLGNLAELYLCQRKYEQAEPLFQRALSILQDSLGPSHAYLAVPLEGLARVFSEQGRYEEAEAIYLRALSIKEKALSPIHPDVAQPLNSLALLYQNQGRSEEAESCYQRALSIREEALGSHHPDLAETLHGFASLREAQGNTKEAAALYSRALSIREQVFGSQHPKTIETRERLRAVLIALNQPERAAQLDVAQLER